MLLENALKERFGHKDFNLSPVYGGDINEAFRLNADGHEYFVKYNSAHFSKNMFLAEKAGLELLSSKGGVNIPVPLEVIELKHGAALLLEWINTGNSRIVSWENFGIQLARLHRSTSDHFGLDHNNYIGRLAQSNKLSNKWLEFYHDERIKPQLDLAIEKGLLENSYLKTIERVFENVESLIPDEPSSLLHGDLWSGNLIIDNESNPVFIDPAVYYGNREMDIAMMKLFGGFSEGFNHYQNIFPLKSGWQERLEFYQLYYILVHVNLFGGHYCHSAITIMAHYEARNW